MSASTLRRFAFGCGLAAGFVVVMPSPAYACHSETGWCCHGTDDWHDVNSDESFCCYWEDNQVQKETCG